MYGPDNAFWSRGDGGFINVSIHLNTSHNIQHTNLTQVAIQAGNQCQYDGPSGDVNCP